jgi:uncharacterized protein (DUF302 family)
MSSNDAPSAKAPARLIRLRSRYDFSTTVTRFRDALQTRGIKLFAEIDQSDAASQAGLTLRPTTLFVFGNPKAGTPIMAANPYAAIELPMRAVVSDEQAAGVFIYSQDMAKMLGDEYGINPNILDAMQAASALMRLISGQD